MDHWLDMWNFEHMHPLYSSVNFCTLGKFKSETANILPTDFAACTPKMYSLSMLTGDREYRKAKGVPKTYVKNTSPTNSTCTSFVFGRGRCTGFTHFVHETTKSPCMS